MNRRKPNFHIPKSPSNWLATSRMSIKVLTVTLGICFPLLTVNSSFGQNAGDNQADSQSPSDNLIQPAVGGATSQSTVSAEGDARVMLNFSGTPWSDVLEWFAEETSMSLQKDTWPTGTFSYSDPRRQYTISEAIDAMNLVLMREGYALIRRNQLLLLVDLEDNFVRDYLRELAEPVSPEELDLRANSDYVRVTFPLGTLTAEEAAADLEKLRSPAGSVQVLGASRKVVAADTVGVLKSIRSVLMPEDGSDGPVLEIQLQNRSADEILELARPHLGLEPGVDKGEDISLSMNLMGDRIYATGDPLKLGLLKGLVRKSDIPLPATPDGETVTLENPTFETYSVGAADPTVAFDVISRLLAGMPDVRMTLDPNTQSLVVLARPSDHATIVRALEKLGGETTQLDVIQLRRLDPVAALSTINKYFGKTAENEKGPKVDGDPVTKKLWVRGTQQEIDQVKQLIEMLEGSSASGLLGERVRILPYSGRTAEDALQQLEALWDLSGRPNRIRMVTPSNTSSTGGLNERRLNGPEELEAAPAPVRRPPIGFERPEVAPQPDAETRTTPRRTDRQQPNFGLINPAGPADDDYVLVRRQDGQPAAEIESTETESIGTESTDEPTATDQQQTPAETNSENGSAESANNGPKSPTNQQSKLGSDIIIQMTPQGMVIASDDIDALTEFEELMGMIADSVATSEQKPTVYWLKYIEATVASELLNSILSGASSGGGGGLGDMAGSMLGEIGGGMLGGLLGLGGGGGGGGDSPVLTTTGTVSIVPDARLNALIIQANPIDLLTVESILQVIDREESPEDVRTRPKPQLIPVIYQDANEVATIVKGVYSERIAGAQGQNRQPSPQDLINALRGGGRGGRGGGGQSENNKPIPISISVDSRSNSLIVAAPPQDFEDIRELVEVIDQSGMESEEDVVVIPLKGDLNPTVIQNAVSAILGPQAKTASTQNSSSSTPGTPTAGGDNSSSPSDVQQRIEMFRQMRERMSGGGGSGGRPSFGGGSPFGGGGSPFGGRGGSTRGGQSSGGSQRGRGGR